MSKLRKTHTATNYADNQNTKVKTSSTKQ